MNCPDCDNDDTSIQDTRTIEDGNAVRRRRECNSCQFRFTTYERKNWNSLRVQKRDGTTEPYDQEKIQRSIEMAVEKRPVSADTIREVTADVTREIQSQDTQLVSSDKIGSAVADQLLDLDEVAYVRFVSVYEGYSDPEDFREVLDRVLTDTDTSTAEPTTAAHE